MGKDLKPHVVILGGGVGSSVFTKALKDLPIELTTIVSSFDDGGSTGALRRDYGGIALGDLRQAFFASLPLDSRFAEALNHRFGSGSLYGVNVGNVLLKAFLDTAASDRVGVRQLHQMFGLPNKVYPISYTFAKLEAKLHNGQVLPDQHQIATYLNFAQSGIRELSLSRKATINPEAKQALLRADYILFAPGHFFTSVLPHLYVEGFSEAWKQSRAHKIWFLNLLAHKGQDSFYAFPDYLEWFQKRLGKKPFHAVVVNQRVPKQLAGTVAHRFAPIAFRDRDALLLHRQGVAVHRADLVSSMVRKQYANDTVLRAPLRHDPKKIAAFAAAYFKV